MNKKSIFRVLSLLLTLVMLCGAFVACGEDDGKDTGNDGTVDTNDGDKVLRFDEEIINVLYWTDTNIDEYVEKYEDVAGELVEENIYYRNLYTMEELNISTNYTGVLGNGTNGTTYLTAARNSHMAGGGYDAFCSYSMWGASLALEGITRNLRQYDYIDFTQPWYPEKMVEEASIGGKLYFMTGDISTNNIFMSSLIYYNKQLYADNRISSSIQNKYGSEDIYALVRDDKWTYEVLLELSENMWADTDASGEWSDGDTFGFATYNTLLDNFYYAAGMKILETNGNEITLSNDYKNGDKITKIIEEVGGFLSSSADAFNSGDTHLPARAAFAEGRVLWYLAPASHAYTTFRTTEGLEYGVVPVPKYEEDQEAFGTALSFPYSMWSVASVSSYDDIAAAYLHTLGKYSYQYTRPAIFEQTMKLKYSDDADDSEMWDLVIDSQSYDLGRIFNNEIKEGNQFRSAISSNSKDWASRYAGVRDSLGINIDALNVSLKTLD